MINEKLNLILKDNTSGSTELLQKIIDFFLINPNYLSDNILTELKEHFNTFKIITDFLTGLQKNIHEKNSEQIIEYLKYYSSNTVNELNLLFQNAFTYLNKKTKFVTISNSKTLQFIFSKYRKVSPDLEITILESRPQFEGRILAEALLSNDIKISIVTEAMAANAVENCDAVIIGADKILSNGSVVNKTGSRNLAILCRYFKKPFYVAASKSKFSSTEKHERDFHNAQEIWNSQSKNLNIQNYYFEKIEADLVTAIISN